MQKKTGENVALVTLASLKVVSPQDLLACATYSTSAQSALSAQPFFLVEWSETLPAWSKAQRETIAAWLQRQPCPTIALANWDDGDPLLEAFDVRAADNGDAQSMIDTIVQTPLAAMTLVQVLRTTASLSLQQGLTVESLAYSTLQSGPEYRRWLAQRTPTVEVTDTESPLLTERNEGILQLTLNRPAQRNAISVALRDALVEAFELVVADKSITEVSLRGNGGCFSIGGDLVEFGSTPDPATAHAIRSQRLPAAVLIHCAERVSANLHSACIGAGIEIPAFASHISATKNTFLQLPELQFGLIPGAGGCISIPRRIGRQRTAYMALTGKKINARTSLDWALVDALS